MPCQADRILPLHRGRWSGEATAPTARALFMPGLEPGTAQFFDADTGEVLMTLRGQGDDGLSARQLQPRRDRVRHRHPAEATHRPMCGTPRRVSSSTGSRVPFRGSRVLLVRVRTRWFACSQPWPSAVSTDGSGTSQPGRAGGRDPSASVRSRLFARRSRALGRLTVSYHVLLEPDAVSRRAFCVHGQGWASPTCPGAPTAPGLRRASDDGSVSSVERRLPGDQELTIVRGDLGLDDIELSPDGKRIAARALGDGTVSLWDLTPTSATRVRSMCRRSSRGVHSMKLQPGRNPARGGDG